jgi:hypothetical protein
VPLSCCWRCFFFFFFFFFFRSAISHNSNDVEQYCTETINQVSHSSTCTDLNFNFQFVPHFRVIKPQPIWKGGPHAPLLFGDRRPSLARWCVARNQEFKICCSPSASLLQTFVISYVKSSGVVKHHRLYYTDGLLTPQGSNESFDSIHDLLHKKGLFRSIIYPYLALTHLSQRRLLGWWCFPSHARCLRHSCAFASQGASQCIARPRRWWAAPCTAGLCPTADKLFSVRCCSFTIVALCRS